jgi:hypothetical protein
MVVAMRPLAATLLPLALALAACIVESAPPPEDHDRPRLLVRTTDDFEVDGKGAHPAWTRADWIPLRRRQPEGAPYEARFKLLHSPKGLYVLFEGTDRRLSATNDKDFAALWLEDVFEAFFWTDERFPVYFEYEISPLGAELPLLVPNADGIFHGWLPWMYEGGRKVRKAVAILGGEAKPGAEIQGWRAEIFIPYELLKPLQNVPPRPGTRWRANFYRIDVDGGRTTQWEWSPVGPSFHEIRKFGVLVFE